MQPRPMAETVRLLLPSLRVCILILLCQFLRILCARCPRPYWRAASRRGQAGGVAGMDADWAAGGAAGAPLMAWLADSAGFMLPFVLASALCAASAGIAPGVSNSGGDGQKTA